MSLKRRSAAPELMDDPDVPYEEFAACLRGLEKINLLTLAYRPTLQWVGKMLARAPDNEEELIILDTGSGGGDTLRQIEKRLGNQPAALLGIDLSDSSRRYAEGAAPQSAIQYVTGDVFSFEAEHKPDLVISSLFTHHLKDREVVRYLQWLDANARHGWFINDLHRHWLPYHFIKTATGMFSRNRLIRNDAAVSVARSFTKEDWLQLLQEAGVSGRVAVQWVFPFRICVSCEKS